MLKNRQSQLHELLLLDIDNVNMSSSVATPKKGGNFTLSCSVNANPVSNPSQWTWKRNGIPISTGSSILTLHDLKPTDSANYECVLDHYLANKAVVKTMEIQCKYYRSSEAYTEPSQTSKIEGFVKIRNS